MRLLPALLLLAVRPCAAESWPSIPLLPAIVQLETDRSPFCESHALLWALNYHAFQRVVRAEHRPPYDFIVTCAMTDGKTAVEFHQPERGRVRGLKVDLGGDEQKTAVVIARELATQSKVIDAVLERRLDKTAYQRGLPADEAFKRGEWAAVVTELEMALESSVPDAAFFFSLYAAHAGLGHAEKAKWYLAAFARASGTRFSALRPKQLAFIQEMVPAPVDDLARIAALQQDIARATLAKDWPETLRLTKEFVVVAPWHVSAYESLRKSYDALDWDPFADHWKRREKLARDVSRDSSLHDDIEKAIRAP